MDVLTHAIEAYTSRAANPISDALAFGAIQLVADNLELLVTGDLRNLDRRAAMHTASHMAGCVSLTANSNSLTLVNLLFIEYCLIFSL